MRFEQLEEKRLLTTDAFADLVVLTDNSFSILASDGDSFAVADSVSIPSNGMDVMVLDFDGDGTSELIGRFNGEWRTSHANSNVDGLRRLASWADIAWQDVHTGDLNGDGRTDIAGRSPGGEWWMLRNDGEGKASNRYLGRWNPTVAWKDVAFAEFTGDGITDVIARSGNEWWLAEGSASGLLPQRFLGRWSDVAWTDISVGQFTGDAKSDIAGRAPDGTWWTLQNDGQHFTAQYMRRWGTATSWSDIIVGDFDNDGFDDILGRSDQNEWWRIHRENGSFRSSFWAQWGETSAWTDVVADDFTGDGQLDLVGRAVDVNAQGGSTSVGWVLSPGDNPIRKSTWLSANAIPANAKSLSGRIVEQVTAAHESTAENEVDATFAISLSDDHQFQLTGAGQELLGLQLISPDGFLVPGDSAAPFAFYLSNDANMVTLGQLGDTLIVNGTIPLDIYWNLAEDLSQLEAQVGFKHGNGPIPLVFDAEFNALRIADATEDEVDAEVAAAIANGINVTLDDQNRFVLNGETKDLLFVEFRSPNGNLVPIAGRKLGWEFDNLSDPFRVLLANDPHEVSMSVLRASYNLDGSVSLEIGWEDGAPTDDLIVNYITQASEGKSPAVLFGERISGSTSG